MDKNNLISQQMDKFVELFNLIPKTISFNNSHWYGANGSMAGLIHNEDHRLIMAHGEMAKTTDRFKRRVILFGTKFGIMAIYPTAIQPSRNNVPTLSYHTTQSLADTLKAHFTGGGIPLTGKLIDHANFPFLDPDRLFEIVDWLATYCEERFIYVGDGMKKPEVRRAKKSAPRAKPAQAGSAVAKPRQGGKPHKGKPHTPRVVPAGGDPISSVREDQLKAAAEMGAVDEEFVVPQAAVEAAVPAVEAPLPSDNGGYIKTATFDEIAMQPMAA